MSLNHPAIVIPEAGAAVINLHRHFEGAIATEKSPEFEVVSIYGSVSV